LDFIIIIWAMFWTFPTIHKQPFSLLLSQLVLGFHELQKYPLLKVHLDALGLMPFFYDCFLSHHCRLPILAHFRQEANRKDAEVQLGDKSLMGRQKRKEANGPRGRMLLQQIRWQTRALL